MATHLIRRPTPTASTRRMPLAPLVALPRPLANLRTHPLLRLRLLIMVPLVIQRTRHTLRRHTESPRRPRALGRVRAGLIMLITLPLTLQVKNTLIALTAQGQNPPQRTTGRTPRRLHERSGRPALPKRRLNLKYVTERRASPRRQGRRGRRRWAWTLARCGASNRVLLFVPAHSLPGFEPQLIEQYGILLETAASLTHPNNSPRLSIPQETMERMMQAAAFGMQSLESASRRIPPGEPPRPPVDERHQEEGQSDGGDAKAQQVSWSWLCRRVGPR